MQRIAYARDLLKKGGFTFDKDRSIERSRRKTAAWPKDEAEMQQVWKDMVEEQLLSEILRRETVARLAKEQNKPDPLANEKPAEEKLLMRYERIQRNIQETDLEDVAETLLSAVAMTYDPHTDYMAPAKWTASRFPWARSSPASAPCWAVKTTAPPKSRVSSWAVRLTNPESSS